MIIWDLHGHTHKCTLDVCVCVSSFWAKKEKARLTNNSDHHLLIF